MSSSPLAPRLLKGALVNVDLSSILTSAVVFQYNPESVSRTLSRGAATSGGMPWGLEGSPSETLSMTVALDAADQLEAGDAVGEALGLHPQLAALEMLLHPPSASLISHAAGLALGLLHLAPEPAPTTLLIWGASRLVPVSLKSMTLTEELFDAQLNPIQATAQLSLEVLSPSALDPSGLAWALYLTHQGVKEALAAVSVTRDLSAAVGAALKL